MTRVRKECPQTGIRRSTATPAQRERTAASIVIGDEILSGSIEDTNSRYLARTLRELGVRLMANITLPDDPSMIGEAVRICRQRFDVVFVSGGLGPTHDDVTLAAVSQALGVPIVHHEGLEKDLRALYRKPLNQYHLKMAEVPLGAELHYCASLPLPVVSIENIYLFPGIPELFEQKLDAIKERFRSSPFFSQEVLSTHTESEIASLLYRTLEIFPTIKIGSYPRWRDERYKVTLVIESKDEGSVKEASQYLATRLKRKRP